MIIFKIVIYIVIICITSYIGIELASGLKERELILNEMITFLTILKNEISYTANCLPQTFEIARKNLKTKLKDVIGAIGIDIVKYGADKVDNCIDINIQELTSLKPYDKDIFTSTLKNLGRSDIDSQINIIDNAVKLIQIQVKEANEYKVKNVKLYRSIGIISGLLIVIIFI